VFGYPGLHVLDGSTVGANLGGVNPALTIAAQAERALSRRPRKGRRTGGRLLPPERDWKPAAGSARMAG